jgi:maltose alpha-D-glucosyltransferase / alpha-amylase
MAESAAGREVYPELRKSLPSQLPAYLMNQRWFGGKARAIRSVDVLDVVPIPLPQQNQHALLLIISVQYAAGVGEGYALPVLRQAASPEARENAFLRVEGPQGNAGLVLVDALKNEAFLSALLQLIEQRAVIPGEKGQLRASQTSVYSHLVGTSVDALRPIPVRAEQSNSSVIYGDRLILKVFRRVEEGINPDLEIGLFLTEKAHFKHTPQVAGSLQYHTHDGKDRAQGILQAFIPNQGDAWRYTLTCLADFYRTVDQSSGEAQKRVEVVRAVAGPYLESAVLLGHRTAEMHRALASDPDDRAFAPEPFTSEFQQQLEKSMLELTGRVFGQLREKLTSLPAELQSRAKFVSDSEKEIVHRFQSALGRPMHATRTRIHGDYHLGQVLYTGPDFVIIDFEGEPARSLAERRIKRSPLQDVAGMLRSFHYAAFAPLLTPPDGKPKRANELETLGGWAESWNAEVADRFLASYFQTSGPAAFLQKSREETNLLLELHLLEKAVYELGYELNNRPSWVGIPLQGISRLLSRASR